MNRTFQKSPLSLAIALLVAGASAYAQEEPEVVQIAPGVYATVDENEIYIDQGDQRIELKAGEAAFAGADGVEQLDAVPVFLNWPCGLANGQGAGSLPTYSIDSLPGGDRVAEIARLFFEQHEVPDTLPNWINGDTHGTFSAKEIETFVTSDYWYTPGETTPKLASIRPKTLLITLFPSTGQVIADSHQFDQLREIYGDNDIPVVFRFEAVNVVPVSYFGPRTSLGQVTDKFLFNQISVAEVPLWYAGDRHFEFSPKGESITYSFKKFQISIVHDCIYNTIDTHCSSV
jgi:hypothetical protein